MSNLPVDILFRFVLLVSGETTIGVFDLNSTTKKWTFKYVDYFNELNLKPLDDFPEIGHTYGHEACSRWLASRVSGNGEIEEGISFKGSIGCKNNSKRHNLEVHILH